jgi:ribosomal protein S18 acetylase RimI-like enzyme
MIRTASVPRGGFARMREVLAMEGIKGIALKVLARSVFREVILVERELRNLWLEPSTDVPMRVRRLRHRDIPAYLELRPDQSEEEVLKRFESGHFSYVTWTEGRISSAVWQQDGPVWIPEVDYLLPLGTKEVYSYDSFTAPELRGRNVAPARGAQTTRLLRACGYRTIIGFVLPENRAAFRQPEKLGFKRSGRIGYLQLGPARLQYFQRGDENSRWTMRRAPRSLMRRPTPELL